jgi:hypothetical protein
MTSDAIANLNVSVRGMDLQIENSAPTLAAQPIALRV